jgi:hypothetical protein
MAAPPLAPVTMPDVAEPPAPPPVMVKGLNPAYAVGFVAIMALIIGAVLLWPRGNDRGPLLGYRPTATAPATSAAPAATTSAPPPQVAEASVTVTSATTDTADPLLAAPVTASVIETATAPPVTATLAPPVPTQTAAQPRPTPVQPKPQPTPPRPRATPAEPAATDADAEGETESPIESIHGVATYTEDGDDDENARALQRLRQELRGTKRVALRAAGMQVEVVRALREQAPDLEFAAYADVVIRFQGNNERLGRGRKRRAGTAIVLKHGRPIFRYEMPDEVYRVGETAAEAFASVFGKALDE